MDLVLEPYLQTSKFTFLLAQFQISLLRVDTVFYSSIVYGGKQGSGDLRWFLGIWVLSKIDMRS
jgi:hypothetical protein